MTIWNLKITIKNYYPVRTNLLSYVVSSGNKLNGEPTKKVMKNVCVNQGFPFFLKAWFKEIKKAIASCNKISHKITI